MNCVERVWWCVGVCVLSARSSVDDRVAGLEAGADDYLVKPFVLAELVARVKVQLKVKMLQDRLKEAGDSSPSAPVQNLKHQLLKQQLANAVAEDATVVNAAIVAWEAVSFEDGEPVYRLHYASLTDGSPAAALGLLVAGRRLVEIDLLESVDLDEDDE